VVRGFGGGGWNDSAVRQGHGPNLWVVFNKREGGLVTIDRKTNTKEEGVWRGGYFQGKTRKDPVLCHMWQ